MSDFPTPTWTPTALLSNYDLWSLGPTFQALNVAALTGLVSGPWPVANLAIFSPIVIPQPIVALKLWISNGVLNGNVDVGIYDRVGTRIVSGGGVAQGPVNALQEFDIADTLLGPGLFYLAVAASGTAGMYRSGLGVAYLQALGLAQMAAAYPLPATAVFASIASAYAPVVGLSIRTLVN